MLYAAFYLFGALRQRHETGAWGVLLLFTVFIYWGANHWIGHYAPLSIPLFGLGIFASRYKNKNYGCFNATFIPLTLCLIATVVTVAVTGIKSSVYHVAVNYFVIGTMLLLFTRFRISIPVQRTVLLGALSFDLYLVHNKILTLMKYRMDVVTICNFLALAAVATLVFHLMRTKILKI